MNDRSDADEVEDLRLRLAVAEETLRAIRAGEVDALVVEKEGSPAVFTLRDANEPYRLLVEQMAQGALSVARDGLILYCNTSFAKIVGRSREHVVGTYLHSYLTPGHQSDLAGLLEGSDYQPREILLRNAKSEGIEAYIASAPLTVDGDEILCIAVSDLSKQNLRLLHSAIIEASADAIYALDEGLTVRTWNSGAQKMLGLAPEEAIGRNERELWPEITRGELDLLLQQVRRAHDAVSVETARPREDGSVAYMIYRITPLTDPSGKPSGYSVVAHDITERKRAEKHRELLINELNHRVKNTLAIVQGIAHQSFKGADVPSDARKAFLDRLSAHAAAHNLLTQANWEVVSLHALAHEIVRAARPERERFLLQGPQILLQPKQALTLGMALHELCTNAIKYGALSNESGCVAVEWSVQEVPAQQLRLTWRERNGPPVKPPQRRGFGTNMVEQGLAKELAGKVTMDFKPGGFVCTLECPLGMRGELVT
jgi:PAS domain S-box-containing protein